MCRFLLARIIFDYIEARWFLVTYVLCLQLLLQLLDFIIVELWLAKSGWNPWIQMLYVSEQLMAMTAANQRIINFELWRSLFIQQVNNLGLFLYG